MTDDKKMQDDFEAMLSQNEFAAPQVGELIKGEVVSASRAEVKLDINGYLIGVVRGPELYEEDEDYANLKPGDIIEATVIEGENENGELELSFRFAGQEKAWLGLRQAYEDKSNVKVRIIDANKGGLLVKYRQISGFLPVSQLAPENYPRINGGDKSKILEKLKSYVGRDFEARVVTFNEKEDKIIFSEKEAWNERQRDVISQYSVGTPVEGTITAITDFGVFISFGENLEGLIHISELAWQRIDNPSELFNVGDIIKAEVISLEGSKIFLSAKKLMRDPWDGVAEKYKIGQVIKGKVLKVNPFGLFVQLDSDIHGLAHISQLGLAPKQRVNDKYKVDEEVEFTIVSVEPKEHRLGLAAIGVESVEVKEEEKKTATKVEDKE
ncbi:S1 RNA-binding domain-containing protein [Candidatus Parcubacteria bacterium]|nr:S1 RNA-binding domain-containing protein [Patescibacteria group bacterium]MBU4309556.1 S1 RNA-binding domain-containing protein [Patescibacteria group bacterium]MBU4432342.1 S1 RNA-binding domain-containing protein [Patescibacteria group bacterium]MBU4578056.1 S1 RNA-binding domain-containing protein [Patescibacteria group bacterium]MCG2696436.1 S1 RNA-binding domain-containing protein [Candidatus Parcubacteria bacterium]